MGVRGFQNGLQLLSETAQTNRKTPVSAGPAGPGSFPECKHTDLNSARVLHVLRGIALSPDWSHSLTPWVNECSSLSSPVLHGSYHHLAFVKLLYEVLLSSV